MNVKERKYLLREGQMLGGLTALILYNIRPTLSAMWLALVMVLWLKSLLQQNKSDTATETNTVP